MPPSRPWSKDLKRSSQGSAFARTGAKAIASATSSSSLKQRSRTTLTRWGRKLATGLSRRSKITLAGARPIDCGTLGGFRTSRDGLRRAKLALAHAIYPGWLRRSSLVYRRVCALLAPCHPGASAALFAQVIFSRLLTADLQIRHLCQVAARVGEATYQLLHGGELACEPRPFGVQVGLLAGDLVVHLRDALLQGALLADQSP